MPVLKIKNLSFRYSYNSDFILKDLNLTINHKDKILIIGSSGSGKSTIFNLILDPTLTYSGIIEVYGKNLKDYNENELFHILYPALPNNSLFSSTLKNNISDKELNKHLINISQLNRCCFTI